MLKRWRAGHPEVVIIWRPSKPRYCENGLTLTGVQRGLQLRACFDADGDRVFSCRQRVALADHTLCKYSCTFRGAKAEQKERDRDYANRESPPLASHLPHERRWHRARETQRTTATLPYPPGDPVDS